MSGNDTKKNYCKKVTVFVLLLFMFSLIYSNQAKAAVKINKTDVTIIKGETVKLKVTGTKKKVKWKSLNRAVATVDKNGLVTAKKSNCWVFINAKVNKKVYVCKVTVIDVTCDAALSTEDGGDLITAIDSSKSVLTINLSHKVKSLQVDVCDTSANVINSYNLGSKKSKKCIWDLTDVNGKKVHAGGYYYVIRASGCTFTTDTIWVMEKSEFASGNGSKKYPYEVTNFAQFNKIPSYRDKSFIQTADIDAGYEACETKKTMFSGTYDGNGYTIRNIIVNEAKTSRIGVFMWIDDAGTVKNLNLDSCSFTGYSEVGGICGVNQGIIKNCAVRNTELLGTGSGVGGICGISEASGEIEKCITKQNVVTVQREMAGGIVGYNMGLIRSCKSTNDKIKSAQAQQGSGGIVSINTGRVEDCAVSKAEIVSTHDKSERRRDRSMKSGGIATENSGVITGCTVSECKIQASCKIKDKADVYAYAGGICANNTGTVSENIVTDSQIGAYAGFEDNSNDGYNYMFAGGIAGKSTGVVAGNHITSCDISVRTTGKAGDKGVKRYGGVIVGFDTGVSSRNIYNGVMY